MTKGLGRPEQKANEDEVQDPEPDIAQPPAQGREFPSTARPAKLPQGDYEQAGKDGEGQTHLLPRPARSASLAGFVAGGRGVRAVRSLA